MLRIAACIRRESVLRSYPLFLRRGSMTTEPEAKKMRMLGPRKVLNYLKGRLTYVDYF